uniref:Uncharacterized protein n=1 Tax=Salix viminalis TaxID=40686 RepID=A0A6N2M3F4_SALVM
MNSKRVNNLEVTALKFDEDGGFTMAGCFTTWWIDIKLAIIRASYLFSYQIALSFSGSRKTKLKRKIK